jgi:hypothetical protein
MSDDCKERLFIFNDLKVKYLIGGGDAVSFHTQRLSADAGGNVAGHTSGGPR